MRPRTDRPLRLLRVGVLPFALLAVGTVGYMAVERWSFGDALWMAVITVTTIGYGEVRPLDAAGRAFTVLFALGGVFTLFYAASETLRVVIGGELEDFVGVRRMEKRIASLKDHVIVCGFGRMGQAVCAELSRARAPYVVVEKDGARLVGFDLPHGLPLAGDATDDDVLKNAGLARARALVTVVGSDADNVFVTMSARLLNDKLAIVARGEGEGAAAKLLRAGASRVVSPYTIGGGRVAQAVLRPTVLDFIEVATRKEHLDLQIEEAAVAKGSRLDGGRLAAMRALGVIVVAVKGPDARMTFNPPDDTTLTAGDTVVMLGPRAKLDDADAMARA